MWIHGGAALALALAASSAAAGDELWRAEATGEPCSIALENALGGVEVSPAGETARISSAAPNLAIEALERAGELVLTVVERGDGSGGDIELTVPSGCRATVRTGHGAVEVNLGAEPLPIAVETVTGDITVSVPPDAPATIALATSGEITTDYTIELEFGYHREPAKHGRIVIAEDASAIVSLTSRRGAIRVLRP